MNPTSPIILAIISACGIALSPLALAQNAIEIQSITSGASSSVSANETSRLFSAIGQPVAYSSGALTENKAGFLQVSNYVTTDNAAPVIMYAGAAQGITLGAPGSFSATITDNIKVSSVKLFHRPVSAENFASADLSGSSSTFTVAIQQSWHDAIGIEYYFTAADGSGNETRSPESGSYYAYLTSSNVTVPQLTAGKEVTNYHIIAMPYSNEGGDDIATILGGSGLHEYSDTKWRIATFDNGHDEFIEPSTGLTKFERGMGYWFITRTWPQGGLKLGEKKAPANNRSSLYSLTLKPGWNQIGNPYPVAITWSDVQSFAGNPSVGSIKVYEGGWMDGDVIGPFEGGFVMNTGSSDVEVKIPFTGQLSEGGRKGNAMGTHLNEAQWRIPLFIVQESQFNKIAAFGMAPDSRLEEDYLDDYNPPGFVKSPEIDFYRETLPRMKLAKDMVPTAENFIWRFNVMGENGVDSKLSWSDDLGYGSQALFLLDKKTLQLVDMREQSSYIFTLSQGQAFAIYFGDLTSDDIGTDEISITAPAPNPAINRRTSFKLGFPQGENYRVQLAVYSGTGALVHEEQQVFHPGIHQWNWTAGETAPPGFYYYRIIAQSTGMSKLFTGKIFIP